MELAYMYLIEPPLKNKKKEKEEEEEEEEARAGNELSNILAKSSQARKKPPLPKGER